MKVYKIRQKDTGLFSTGGMRPRFVKQGKLWSKLGYVHSHIQQLHGAYTPADVYNGCEIVEAEITEILKPIENATDWLAKTYDDQIERWEEYIARSPDNEHYKRYKELAVSRKAQLK